MLVTEPSVRRRMDTDCAVAHGLDDASNMKVIEHQSGEPRHLWQSWGRGVVDR